MKYMFEQDITQLDNINNVNIIFLNMLFFIKRNSFLTCFLIIHNAL